MRPHLPALTALALGLLSLAGCSHAPVPPAAETFRSPSSAWSPQLRTVEAASETALLSAASDALQDLGYMVIASETSLGVITAQRTPSRAPTLADLIVVRERLVERVTVAVRPTTRPARGWIVQTSWERTAVSPGANRLVRALPSDGGKPAEQFFASLRTKLSPAAVP